MNLTWSDAAAISGIVVAICTLAGVFVKMSIKNTVQEEFIKIRAEFNAFDRRVADGYLSVSSFQDFKSQIHAEYGRVEGQLSSYQEHTRESMRELRESLQAELLERTKLDGRVMSIEGRTP